MGPTAALLIATPLFGFQLQVDVPAQPVLAPTLTIAQQAMAEEAEPEEDDGPSVGEQMQLRGKLTPIHRNLGIATWVSMTMTVVLGGIQYWNLYGMFAGRDSNPCVKGTAVFGQGQCSGTPVPHAISAGITSALYYTTWGLSVRMPDPLNLSEGTSDYARKLCIHKVLRWVHFAGMAAQIVLGVVVANSEAFGLDRSNDYTTLQALSTVHYLSGLMTWGALTGAAAVMLF